MKRGYKATLGQAVAGFPLSTKITAASARAAKAVIIRDLAARSGILRASADSGNHDEKGRAALLVAVRVLDVTIADIRDNLVTR